MPLISPQVSSFLEAARVGRLATLDPSGAPDLVPICFCVRGSRLYCVIDEKPKHAAPMALKRVRNLLADPRLSVVVDHYEEDWVRLGWVLLRGSAEVLSGGPANRTALALLREKYPQYGAMALEEKPLIRMRIQSVSSWGDLTPPGPA